MVGVLPSGRVAAELEDASTKGCDLAAGLKIGTNTPG
jgi:hypothetical protein